MITEALHTLIVFFYSQIIYISVFLMVCLFVVGVFQKELIKKEKEEKEEKEEKDIPKPIFPLIKRYFVMCLCFVAGAGLSFVVTINYSLFRDLTNKAFKDYGEHTQAVFYKIEENNNDNLHYYMIFKTKKGEIINIKRTEYDLGYTPTLNEKVEIAYMRFFPRKMITIIKGKPTN